MSVNDPAVKHVITKKSPDIIITEDDNNIVLDSTDGTSDAGGKLVGSEKVLVERFWADDVIKFSGTYLFVPDALADEDVGSKITLEEFETPSGPYRDGVAIWYWPNGNKHREYTYVNGYLHGSYKIWWEDGEKNTVGERSTTWIDGVVGGEGEKEKRKGTWKYYDEEGTETETVWSE